ncbi:HD domain-containing protein [Lichenicola cladoniae]|uniref:HD domain-containing protein n=1 Tax=Lichenicola cladoniae TaxID=1484109 RepID=A0A6M8HTN7_9PROT|nr:HD domain-containing phosphohydrolase [Lichenicola cladoniae]QKE91527.1 HD domain-containing protein [Lichenicola cladoniae]
MLAKLARLSASPSQVRVGAMVRRLATLAGLEPAETEGLIAAIPLYDIGMISVPEAILCKSGLLDERELGILQRHTEVGARLLVGTPSPAFEFAAELALCHHEFWNGEGYPRRLAADDIPIGARIVALADAFDALASERLNGTAWSIENAARHIAVEAGRRYDPTLVKVFLDDLPMMLALRSPGGNPDPHDRGSGQPKHWAMSMRGPLVWPAALAGGLLDRSVSVSHARLPVPPTADLA